MALMGSFCLCTAVALGGHKSLQGSRCQSVPRLPGDRGAVPRRPQLTRPSASSFQQALRPPAATFTKCLLCPPGAAAPPWGPWPLDNRLCKCSQPNRNHRRGIIAKGPREGRSVPHRVLKRFWQRPGSVLAVPTRGCCRCDLHVLTEDGLEGLVPVHHGAEHQRLGGNAVREQGPTLKAQRN